jgi:hypothetical protein
VVIPSRGNEPIEVFFMGMKALYPGKPIYTNTLILTTEEFEDIKMLDALYKWQENVFSTDPASNHAGSAGLATKSLYTTDVILRMYKQVGDQSPVEKRIRIKNAWPSNIDDVPLAYDTQESVKPVVTLSFDYWTLEDNTL